MTSPLVREYRATDAEDIAIAFNQQHDVWPGGFNNGKDLTATDIERWQEHSNAIAVYISIEDGHARAYCSLLKSISEDQDSCYVGLLGCSSKFHGHGHGRELLRAAVGRAIKEKNRRVDLHTWAGNLKAVPLYKKTGFMWVPKTEVFMQNFIPMVVLCPLAESFFDGVDWYAIHERELRQSEDFEEWRGMEVYTYCFNRDGKKLHVKINRKARQIVYFEDDDIKIALLEPSEKPLKGRNLKMNLEIERKTDKYGKFKVKGFGEKGIECDHSANPKADKTINLEIPFSVSHKSKKGGDYDSYPSAGVELNIDGKPLTLAIGLETKPVVDVDSSSMYPIVASGIETQIGIELTNNAEKPVKCRLITDDPTGVVIGKSKIELPVEGSYTVPIRVTLERSKVIPIAVEYTIGSEKGKTESFDFPVMASDPVSISSVSYTEKKQYSSVVRFCRDRMVLTSSAKGCSSDLVDPIDSRKKVSFRLTSFGPPFDPSNMSYVIFDQRINDDGSIEMSGRIDRNQNLEHHQKITMLNSGWLAVENSIVNTGDTDAEIGMKFTWKLHAPAAEMNFVHRGKIISGMMVDECYPAENELPIDRSEYDEGWISFEIDGQVWGAVFGKDMDKITRGWGGLSCLYQFKNIPAKGSVKTEPMYFYAGPGTHSKIRDAWLRFINGEFAKSREPEKRPLRQLFTDPEVPIVAGNTEVEICVDSYRLIPAPGDIKITPDETLDVSKGFLHFENIMRDNPFREKIVISPKDQSVGASGFEMESDSPDGAVKTQVTVLRMKKNDKVSVVSEGDEWIVSNSLAEFRVDKSWGGGIHSFRTFDREWLKSPYPDKDACFCWFNNFRGGIQPAISPESQWANMGHRETWEISECSETCGGLEFKGVELQSVLQSKDELKGGKAIARYMLSKGHRILKIDLEYESIGGKSIRMDNGLNCFIDVHPEFRTHQYFSYGPEYMRRIGKFAKYNKAGDWAIVENDDTGECVLLQMKTEPSYNEQLWVFDMAKPYGQHIGGETTFSLKAGESKKYEFFLVVCSSLDEAHKFRGMKILGK
jgi:ribosomal protein S18 acetylase RimI-like enzyme